VLYNALPALGNRGMRLAAPKHLCGPRSRLGAMGRRKPRVLQLCDLGCDTLPLPVAFA